nr:apoptosis-stimulating of p53 protein 2 [Biomphalaria glabrata]
MYFAVVAKSGQEDVSCVTEEKSGEDNAESKKTSIWVYTSENHGTSIEVPLTPETTVSDVLDCVRDPVRGEGYLVAVAGDTEYILQEGDNAFTFLYQIWNNSGSPLNFLLRYYSQHAEWPPPELEARRHQMRRPPKDQLPAHNEIPDKSHFKVTPGESSGQLGDNWVSLTTVLEINHISCLLLRISFTASAPAPHRPWWSDRVLL